MPQRKMLKYTSAFLRLILVAVAHMYYDYQLSKAGRKFAWSPSFNVKIALLSRATGSVSVGNLSAFDVNWQQSAQNCRQRDRQPKAVDIVTNRK